MRRFDSLPVFFFRFSSFRRLVPAALIPLVCLCCMSCNSTKKTPVPVLLVNSEMQRVPNSWQLDFKEKIKWDYASGVELAGMIAAADFYGIPAVKDYFIAYCDTMVNDDGTIKTYKPSEESLDRIHSAKLFFRAYEETGKDKYRKALDLVFSQFSHQPRNADGGFWHKRVYPYQMWLDGLYMGEPFYAQYLTTYADELGDSALQAGYEDIVNQFVTCAHHTFDASTGLFRHAYDDARQQAWADSLTGQSAHCWGRALGWYSMALVDVMDWLPSQYQAPLDSIFSVVAAGVARYQDDESGLWFQVMDQPGREGNYLESSCSAMFTYALYKGIRTGHLPESYLSVAERAYEGMLAQFIETDSETGLVSLTRTCAVAGLGGNPYRSGTFDYYVGETIRANDPKAVGPFLLACIEHDKRLQRSADK